MPVTLTRGKIKVKKSDGTYASYDAITDNSTAAMLEQLQATWTEAWNQVLELQSQLPEDYTRSVSKMNDLDENAVPITSGTIDRILEYGGEA